MSGFECPNCHHKTNIFAPNTGGAEQMCKELNLNYFGKIPLDPSIMEACEMGKSLIEAGSLQSTKDSFT